MDENDSSTADAPAKDSGKRKIGWKAIVIAVFGIYAVMLIVLNSGRVSVDFVLFQTHTRLIFLVLLSMALGALIMWLVPKRRGRGKS